MTPCLPFLAGVLLLSLLATTPAVGLPCAPPLVDDTLRVGFAGLTAPLRTGDLDLDGTTDLVALDAETGALWVLWGRKDRDLGPPRRLATPPAMSLHAVLDFHGLGKTDLLVGTSSGPAVFLGDGAGGFRRLPVTGVDLSLDPLRWRIADVDGDGRLDVVVLTAGPVTSIDVYVGDGQGAFHRAGSSSLAGVSSSGGTLALADVNADGVPDAIVAATTPPNGGLYVLTGVGGGAFGSPREIARGRMFGVTIRTDDLDRDGSQDLLVVTGEIIGIGGRFLEAATVYWGDGRGAFTSSGPIATSTGGSFSSLDVDLDGRTDLVFNCPQYPCVVGTYLMRSLGERRFAPPTLLTSGSTDVQVADVDGDGIQDLVPSRSAGALGSPILVNRCGGAPFARSFLVPVVLSARGVGDARFTSELVLTNHGPNDVAVELTYSASFGGGSGGASVPLPQGRQRIVTDVIAELRALGVPIPEGDGRAGSLRVRFAGASSPADVSAQARTVSPYADGEVGVGFAPLPVSGGITGPSIVPLLRETADSRTNLALVSLARPEDGSVVLRAAVISTDPAHPGTSVLPDVPLAPGQFVQIDRVLLRSGLGATAGWCRIERVGGDAAYAGYAVLNDNASADGSVVAAVAEPTLRTSALLLPVVAETAAFTTEVVLTNASSLDRTITLELQAPGVAAPSHLARRSVTVRAGGQVSWPAFAKDLCAFDASAACVGSVRIWDTADSSGLLGLALIRGTGTSAGTGLAIAAGPQHGTWLTGLRQDDRHRSNLALVNPSITGTAHFRLEVFDGETGDLAASVADVAVGDEGWKQLSSFLSTHAPGVSNAYVRVTRLDANGNAFTYAVLNDGGGPGLGTGDGTYLAAQ